MADQFRILTFDIVGTLIDFERGILDCLHERIGAEALTATDAELLAGFGRAEAVQQELTPDQPFSEMLAPAYLRMAEELALPDSDEIATSLRASIPTWPAFPDSVDALKRLGAGRRLVGLTNAGRWAAGHMARTLGDPFDDIVTVEDVGVNKPNPQVFAYCRGRHSVDGYQLSDYLHVAQSQYHDIGVAHELGFKTAWIERRAGQDGFGGTPAPSRVTKPDYHFTTLAELADALEPR